MIAIIVAIEIKTAITVTMPTIAIINVMIFMYCMKTMIRLIAA